MTHYETHAYRHSQVSLDPPAPPPSLCTNPLTPQEIARWVESVERVAAAREREGLCRLSPRAILQGLGLISPRADVVVAVIEGRVDL